MRWPWYIPDIVNIYIGSPESYRKQSMDILIQDLSAKYGTTLSIAGWCEGPRAWTSLFFVGRPIVHWPAETEYRSHRFGLVSHCAY